MFSSPSDFFMTDIWNILAMTRARMPPTGARKYAGDTSDIDASVGMSCILIVFNLY